MPSGGPTTDAHECSSFRAGALECRPRDAASCFAPSFSANFRCMQTTALVAMLQLARAASHLVASVVCMVLHTLAHVGFTPD